MTDIENFVSIAKRKGYERIPIDFVMSPHVAEKFSKEASKYSLPHSMK